MCVGGITCCIGNLHAKNHDKSCIIRSSQVITNQPADFLLDWDETQPEGSGDIGKKE